jgi:uncharacterized membrane protein
MPLFSRGATLDQPRSDPVDHERTTRAHAGESMKDGANLPGIAAVAVAVVALVVGLIGLATEQAGVGAVSLIVAIVTGIAGALWLVHAHRKVRAAELRWEAARSGGNAPPPTS